MFGLKFTIRIQYISVLELFMELLNSYLQLYIYFGLVRRSHFLHI